MIKEIESTEQEAKIQAGSYHATVEYYAGGLGLFVKVDDHDKTIVIIVDNQKASK